MEIDRSFLEAFALCLREGYARGQERPLSALLRGSLPESSCVALGSYLQVLRGVDGFCSVSVGSYARARPPCAAQGGDPYAPCRYGAYHAHLLCALQRSEIPAETTVAASLVTDWLLCEITGQSKTPQKVMRGLLYGSPPCLSWLAGMAAVQAGAARAVHVINVCRNFVAEDVFAAVTGFQFLPLGLSP